MTGRLRVIVVLPGDVRNEPANQIKYGGFLDALAEHWEIVDVHDANLHGLARAWNAMTVAHPNRRRWRERLYQNVPAFRMRSRRLARHLHARRDDHDLVLQVGGLFDATWDVAGKPVVVYTDYTMALSARRADAGRAPLTAPQLRKWLSAEADTYARALHVFTRAQFVRRSVIEDYGVDGHQVSAIGGGVNGELPVAPADVASEPPVALFIGLDFRRKGGDLVLQAFRQVKDALPEAKLVMVTDGPVPAQDLPAGIDVRGRIWDRRDVEELYSRASVFVLPSRLETWGDVLLEAMASGLPCIGVAEEAFREIIVDGVTGLLVPPGEVPSLAEALKTLMSDADLRERLGRSGRARVESEYTWAGVARRLVATTNAAMERATRE